jgi:hypothetical protein
MWIWFYIWNSTSEKWFKYFNKAMWYADSWIYYRNKVFFSVVLFFVLCIMHNIIEYTRQIEYFYRYYI